MQNIDFYDGKGTRNIQHNYDNNYDPEYFTRISKFKHKEDIKNKKKASRIIFFITALSIISFTIGLVIGIKFAGGTERKIIDEQTFKAVTGIGSRVTTILKENKQVDKFKKALYPKENYPYVIRVGISDDKKITRRIANLLSSKGITVILSRKKDKYIIYTGPYKSLADAQLSIKKISNVKKYPLASKLKILQRL